MNILQLCSGKGFNGAAYSTLLVTRELAKRGHQVWMACRSGSWIGQQLAGDPVEVIWSDLHRWPLDELRRMAALGREHRIDVLHTHMSRAHLFGVLLRWFSGIPCVATAHCRKFQPHWMFNDYVIAVSEATRRFHMRYNFVRPSRIETVYNFVDPRWSGRVPPSERARVRREFGASDSSPLIAVVGAVIPRKGQLYLIRALPAILRAIPETRLAVVGGWQQRRQYLNTVQAEARRLGVAEHVLFTGIRHDMEAIYAAIDLLVHPALEEPLGRVCLEAMAAGVPLVATDVTGTRECVAHGATGLLVPRADCRALAEATIALLRDPERRRQFGEAGQRRIQAEFSPAAHTQRVEAIFQRVAARRKAA